MLIIICQNQNFVTKQRKMNTHIFVGFIIRGCNERNKNHKEPWPAKIDELAFDGARKTIR